MDVVQRCYFFSYISKFYKTPLKKLKIKLSIIINQASLLPIEKKFGKISFVSYVEMIVKLKRAEGGGKKSEERVTSKGAKKTLKPKEKFFFQSLILAFYRGVA